MTLEQLADVALALLLVGWICARQLRWSPVDARRLWALPAVLAVVGLGQLLRAGTAELSGTELALLAIEASVAIGTGALIGGITTFRPLADPERVRAARERSRGGAMPALECRTGWAGVALWTVLILVRIGTAVEAASLGAAALESAGVILLMVALNRAARAAVVLARTGRRTPAGTGTMGR